VLAKIKNYGISMTKENLPQVSIDFECADGKSRTWRGSLKSEASRAITFKALDVCGFKGDDPGLLAAGLETGLLDTQIDVDLTIANETYNEKTFEKIKWINAVGGHGFKNALSKEDAAKVFNGMNLKAGFAAHRALNPKKKEDAPF